MRRPPQEIVLQIADALKTSRPGDLIMTADIHRKSGVHYRTLQAYFEMIGYVQSKLPHVVHEESSRGSGVRILSTPRLDLSGPEELMLLLFDRGAFREASAIPIPDTVEAGIVAELVKAGSVTRKGESVCLSPNGIAVGAELADRREDALIRPIGRLLTKERIESRAEFSNQASEETGWLVDQDATSRSAAIVACPIGSAEYSRGDADVDRELITREEAM